MYNKQRLSLLNFAVSKHDVLNFLVAMLAVIFLLYLFPLPFVAGTYEPDRMSCRFKRAFQATENIMQCHGLSAPGLLHSNI